MVQCMPKITETLTGRTRERPAWLWRRVKQVEVRRTSYPAADFNLERPIASWLAWRDAIWADTASVTVDHRIHVDAKADPMAVAQAMQRPLSGLAP